MSAAKACTIVCFGHAKSGRVRVHKHLLWHLLCRIVLGHLLLWHHLLRKLLRHHLWWVLLRILRVARVIPLWGHHLRVITLRVLRVEALLRHHPRIKLRLRHRLHILLPRLGLWTWPGKSAMGVGVVKETHGLVLWVC